MKLGIDAHCHLEYMDDPEEVVREVSRRMTAAICSVPNPADVEKIVELRRKFPGTIFLCLGFHPEHMKNYNELQIEEYIESVRSLRKDIVGIGEVGLDYNWIKTEKDRNRSKEIFHRFIDLSKELKLPLVIHTRNAQGETTNAVADALRILTDANARDVVMHCFSGNEAQLRYALEQNYWISFATIIAKSDRHKRLASQTPLDRMLLETDAPWLDPDSRELTNRPWKIESSAEIIAEIKNKTKEEVLSQTTFNAKKAFGLKI